MRPHPWTFLGITRDCRKHTPTSYLRSRQYVRTFFGKDVSRFNSPRRDLSIVDHKVRYDVRMNRTAAAAATTTNNNRVGNSFDSKNFNNGWGGRFG